MQSEIAGVSDIANYLVTNHVNPTQKYKLAFKVQHNSRNLFLFLTGREEELGVEEGN